MSKANPFETDDVNPFAEVNAYNPFAPAGRPAQAAPGAPAAAPGAPAPRPSTGADGGLKFDTTPVSGAAAPKSFYDGPLQPQPDRSDELEKFFVDEEPSKSPKPELKVNQPAPKPAAAGPAPSAPSGPSASSAASVQGGIRVSSSADRAEEASQYSFWQVEYYQQFFNVDTMDVVYRCLYSLWPFKFTFIANARNNPDLYGPLWITTTLIFMMAACGNFAQYLGNSAAWHYDFFKVTYGAAVIWGYAILLPLLFWGYLIWADIKMGLSEIICIYGYSLFIYIFVAVLCVIPLAWLQWVVVSLGAAISTAFLVLNLWQPIRDRMAYAIIILAVITLFHLGLGLTFRLYFFQFSPPDELPPATTPPALIPSPSA